jgi:hypothetical protein
MNKNKKIWLIILSIILAIVAIIFFYKSYQGINVEYDPGTYGPGIGCYYVFKTDYNYKDLVVIQQDNNGSYKAVYKSLFAQAKELNNDYTLYASYDCYHNFVDDHFFVNISSEGYDQINWQTDSSTFVRNMESLLIEDSFSEFYYCPDFADTVSINTINDLINREQLLAICEQTK